MKTKTVYIIEQDRITSLDLKMKFERSGYNTVHVNSFVKNENQLDNIPDLIVAYSDMRQMPGFDKIRSVFIENKTPIICIGTKSDFETQEVCKELNIVGMFIKPFNSRDLITFTDDFFVPVNAR